MSSLFSENYEYLKSLSLDILDESKKYEKEECDDEEMEEGGEEDEDEDDEAGEKYENRYKKTGKKAKKDWDKDGKIEGDEADEYAGVRDRAIKKAKKVNEFYSDWRSELNYIHEVSNSPDAEEDRQVKETTKVKNKVEINPKLGETNESSFQVLAQSELTESDVYDVSLRAAEYFINEGLNENGIEILIQTLGEDKFVDYVFDISEHYILTEARKGGVKIQPITKTEKPISSLKGGAKTAAINRLKKEKARVRAGEGEGKPGGMTAALRLQREISKPERQIAVSRAKETQAPTQKKKHVLDPIAKRILSVMNAAQAAKERHDEAIGKLGAAASAVAQHPGVRKAAGSAGQGFMGVLRGGAKLATSGVKKEDYDFELNEVAPPGAKYERMVKHIKGKNPTKKQKEIAYATAWKRYNQKNK